MSGSKGFTLVELLVALVLAVGAVLTLASMSTAAYGRVQRSGQLTKALTLTQQRMEWLRSRPIDSTDLAAGMTTETMTGDFAGYSRVTEIADDIPRSGVKQVTVSTGSPSGRRVQLVSLIADDGP